MGRKMNEEKEKSVINKLECTLLTNSLRPLNLQVTHHALHLRVTFEESAFFRGIGHLDGVEGTEGKGLDEMR